MLKSEFFLQIFIFGLTAAVISLLVFRLYPSKAIKYFKGEDTNRSPTFQKAQSKEEIHPPTAISIPSASLNLSVSPGVIQNNKWTLYDDKISWLSTSEPPGRGNVILYGHNRKGLLGDLDRLEIGEEIIIQNGINTFTYQVADVRRVKPSEVDVIISDKNQLTIYTCDGSFDQRRLVVFAYLKGEST